MNSNGTIFELDGIDWYKYTICKEKSDKPWSSNQTLPQKIAGVLHRKVVPSSTQ